MSAITPHHRRRPLRAALTGRRTPRRGFTLIETAITTVIVGLGTVAMMALLAAGTASNQDTAALTTAVDLASNIHELCDQLPYPTVTWGLPGGQSVAGNSAFFSTGNVSWLDQQTFNPPIDATANSISNLSGWEQEVSVSNVSVGPSSLTTLTPNSTTNPVSCVTVSILHGEGGDWKTVYQTSWLVAQ
jgi:prepilin-type N-terminal cleavage/methylation domain-containing protein